MPFKFLSLPRSSRGRLWAGRQFLRTHKVNRGVQVCVTGDPKDATNFRDLSPTHWIFQQGTSVDPAVSDFGVCLDMPGGANNGAYADVGLSTVLNGSSGTIACWFKPRSHAVSPSGAGALSAVFGRADQDGGGAHIDGIEIYYDHGTPAGFVAKLEGGGTTATLTGTTTLTLGVWYHVAVSWTEGGTVTLYVNGAAEDTDTAPTLDWPAGLQNYIGIGIRSSNNTYVAWPNAQWTLCLWFDRVLGAEEVRELYQDPWCMFEGDPGFAWSADMSSDPMPVESFIVSDLFNTSAILSGTRTESFTVSDLVLAVPVITESFTINDTGEGGFTLTALIGTVTESFLVGESERSDTGVLAGQRYRR